MGFLIVTCGGCVLLLQSHDYRIIRRQHALDHRRLSICARPCQSFPAKSLLQLRKEALRDQKPRVAFRLQAMAFSLDGCTTNRLAQVLSLAD